MSNFVDIDLKNVTSKDRCNMLLCYSTRFSFEINRSIIGSMITFIESTELFFDVWLNYPANKMPQTRIISAQF